jgi:hypothetical protein
MMRRSMSIRPGLSVQCFKRLTMSGPPSSHSPVAPSSRGFRVRPSMAASISPRRPPPRKIRRRAPSTCLMPTPALMRGDRALVLGVGVRVGRHGANLSRALPQWDFCRARPRPDPSLTGIIAERGPKQPDQLARITNPLPPPALVPRSWQQPSFECQRPGEPVALLICSDGELSEWTVVWVGHSDTSWNSPSTTKKPASQSAIGLSNAMPPAGFPKMPAFRWRNWRR